MRGGLASRRPRSGQPARSRTPVASLPRRPPPRTLRVGARLGPPASLFGEVPPGPARVVRRPRARRHWRSPLSARAHGSARSREQSDPQSGGLKGRSRSVSQQRWLIRIRGETSSDRRDARIADTSRVRSSPATRVVLADDDVLLREGLASLLERSGFDVVAQAGDGAAAIRACREQEPDLLVIDIRMPPTHTTEGLEAAHAIRAEYPDVGILVLSAYVEVEHAVDLLASGERSGYLLKSRVTDVDDFLETRRAHRQRRFRCRPSARSATRRGAAHR